MVHNHVYLDKIKARGKAKDSLASLGRSIIRLRSQGSHSIFILIKMFFYISLVFQLVLCKFRLWMAEDWRKKKGLCRCGMNILNSKMRKKRQQKGIL